MTIRPALTMLLLHFREANSLFPKFVFMLFLCSSCIATTFAQALTRDQAEQRARALLQQMNLDEKVGQLNQSAGVVMPMLGSEKPDALITKGGVGSIL